MLFPFFFPAPLILKVAGQEEAKNLAGENVLRLIQIRLTTSSLQEITPACQVGCADPRAQKCPLRAGGLF
jgi:hypothetical protein